MTLIQSLFRRSPVKPMQQHMRVATKCAKQVQPLVEAMASGDLKRLSEIRGEIDRLEHEADDIKNEIRAHLPSRLLMAAERRDMLEILDYQDSIADRAQDIAGLADQRGMTLPEALREPLRDLVLRVLAACDQAQRVIDELDELVETGFRGREVTRVEEMIESLGRIETDTDELAERVTRKLFAMEDELGISTVFWYQLVNWVAGMADNAERVGNRLRLLIAR